MLLGGSSGWNTCWSTEPSDPSLEGSGLSGTGKTNAVSRCFVDPLLGGDMDGIEPLMFDGIEDSRFRT